MKERLWEKLKRVRLKDIGHLFLFFAALLPAQIFRRRRPNLWLICEHGDEARDNGYWFFKYLCEQQSQVDTVYAIRKSSLEYSRVAALGSVIEFGSFRHWIYYLAAQLNISSQKYGKPNAAVCYLLEVVLGVLKNKRVFLQHGITKDNLPFLYYRQTKFFMFCCGALTEYKFIKRNFHYPSGIVQYTGLCRFDDFHVSFTNKDYILIMPTWRMWLERKNKAEGESSFLESDYYRCWSGLLKSRKFAILLETYDKRVLFCMHRNMNAFEHYIPKDNPRIEVLNWQDANISTLLKQAGTLVTDYSSVFMDFAYMKKPMVYYQFDQDDFRSKHLSVGYFDYEEDGFGEICKNEEMLLCAIEKIFESDCCVENKYLQRINAFFTFNDTKNCERTYEAAMKLLSEYE